MSGETCASIAPIFIAIPVKRIESSTLMELIVPWARATQRSLTGNRKAVPFPP